jgi:predicted acyl esterase
MTRTIGGVLLCLALAAGAFAQVRTDLMIPLSSGDSLEATMYVPPGPGHKPALLFVHGFGLTKDADTASARVYAAAGYVTLCYSVRGHGASTGASTIMAGPERADLAEVLDFFQRMPETDNNRIAIVGGSQGGLHGLWAAADHLGVAALSSDVIVPHWASDMLANGSVRRTVVLLLETSSVRYAAERDTLWDLLRADDYDGFRTRFTAGRDVDTAALNASVVPTLRLLKWQDHYFSAGDGIAAFEASAAPKKLYVGTRGHFSDQAESERVYQYDQVTRWLNHFLKDDVNGITDEPLVTFAASSLPMDSAGSFTWTRAGTASWPPAGLQPYRFYLRSDSALDDAPPAAGEDSLFLENLHVDSAYTFTDGFIEGFRGPRFDHALPRRALAFESSVLTSDVLWAGAPRMHLYVRGASASYPLHAQIYEVDSLGARAFINRITFTARHRTPGAVDTLEVAGLMHAHRFTAGSRIRVELTNIDVTNRVQLGTYPFVLPMFADAGVTVFMDAARPSYIEFPLDGAPTAVASREEGTAPEAFTLAQNYPNPFNGSTIVRFTLRATSPVRLEIFDLLGRTVEVPIDMTLLAGEYRIPWRADDRPSGVYFYRLRAGAEARTGKMLLVR